jgi:carboxypeptidase C (cathepsin A)
MKFSVVSVLALSSSVVSIWAQQQGQASQLLRSSSSSSGSSTGSGSSVINVSFDMSACNDIHDEKSCYEAIDSDTNGHCVWCDCQAVPSVCVTKDQSESLPPGVFDCKSPDRRSNDQNSNNNNNADDDKLFRFVEDRTYQLTETAAGGIDGPESICDPSSKSISGYMDIKGSIYDESGDKHLFFWMFEKRGSDLLTEEEKGEIPFVVWLTGGPGCSSTLALLTENGPCSVNKDGKTTAVNPYSWTEAAHVLWLDQPAGVGFSYGDENDSGEAMVSEDAYYFFQAFFQTHPEYSKSPLYVIG